MQNYCSVPKLAYLIQSFFILGSDIYFIGGFGTVAWVDVKEYETLQPDKIAVDGGEQYLKVNFLNSDSNYFFLSPFRRILWTLTYFTQDGY